jgi:hypothetical protein
MLARWLRRWRSGRAARMGKPPPAQPYENPYRHGVCAADWTNK